VKLRAFWKKWGISYLFAAPYVLFFLLFTVIPVLVAMGLSFTSYNMLQPPVWVGWANYVKLLFADDVFLIAVKNTLLFAAITGPLSYMLCLLLAWFINELKPTWRTILTLLFYAPSISGNVFMIWTILFSGDMYGWVNSVLLRLGIIYEPVRWLTNPDTLLWVTMLVTLWMSLGTSFLAFIAGLQGIDETLYEAGAIDGVRNRWQELWFITLPAMRPQLLFGAIINITNAFAAGSHIVALVGFPSTDYAGHTVITHLMDYGNIRFEMGYASAIATLLFAVMLITQQAVQRMLRKIG